MNGALVQQVWNLQNAQLGAALPQLRPLELDDVREVRSAFAGWLNRQQASYSSWQQAWNAWTRATDRHPGRIEFTRTHCPNCHGRRYDARRGHLCHTCLTGSRWRHVSTIATHLQEPATPEAADGKVERTLPAVGQRVKITGVMNDPDPLPVGLTGTVTAVTTFGHGIIVGAEAQISVDWDNGRTLMLVDTDPYTAL